MENQEILETIKKQNQNFQKWILILIPINIILFPMVFRKPSIIEGLKVSLSAYTIGFNIFGLIIGSLLAFLPYKKLRYEDKYKRFVLLTILVIQASGLILTILNAIIWTAIGLMK